MSAKKNNQPEARDTPEIVNPLLLGELTMRVRDLLRFHYSVGITHYPRKEKLQRLFLSDSLGGGRPRQRPGAVTVRRQGRGPQLSIAMIQQQIGDCGQCGSKGHRLRQLPGRGPDHPRLMVVGDFPGSPEGAGAIFGTAEDDMLRKMMAAIKLSMEEVYVCNLVKCVIPDGPPDRECALRCFAHLQQEIAALRPAFILAMGELPASLLTGSNAPLVRLRGRFYSYGGAGGVSVRIMPTFHPRFLLRHAEMKQMVWQDLQMLQRQLGR